MRIFISYSRHNRDVADTIADDLRVRGADVFVDYQRLSAGDSFPDRLRDEIIACDAFVLLMSEQSAASQWVQDEEMLARTLEKQIIPVKVDDLDVARSPFWRCLRLDWVLWDGDAPNAALGRIASAVGLDDPASVEVGLALPEQHRATQASPLQDEWESLPFEPETVLVPAGPFLMGSDPEKDPDARKNEQPQQRVILPDYRIGRYPVTVREYRAFVEAGGYTERRFWTKAGWRQREGEGWTLPRYRNEREWLSSDQLPVVGVTWYEAVAYVRWISEETGREYRLPTESEWEKAARSSDGRIYPWGNEWREGICNALGSGPAGLSLVGYFSPYGDSPYGAADMSGNVWEWCQTVWRNYYETPENNDPEGNEPRVVRGGAFSSKSDRVRCAFRSSLSADILSDNYGFRVVCIRSHE